MDNHKLLSGQDYESWIAENKDIVLPYILANDVAFKSMEMSPAAYNALKYNHKYFMSDIIFESNSSIEEMGLMKKSAANEINMFRRNYLRKHRRELTKYVEENLGNRAEESSAEKVMEQKAYEAEQDKKTDRTIIKKLSSVIQITEPDSEIEEKLVESGLVVESEVKVEEVSSEIKIIEPEYITEEQLSEEHQVAETGPETGEKITVAEQNIELNDNFEVFAVGEISIQTVKTLLEDDNSKEKIVQLLMTKAVTIDKLGLSVRSFNCLKRANIDYLHQVVNLYPDEFYRIRNLGAKSVDELRRVVENNVIEFFKHNNTDVNEFVDDENNQEVSELTIPELSDADKSSLPTVKKLLCNKSSKKTIIQLFMLKEIPIEKLNLSVRSFNCLVRSHVDYFHQIVDLYPDGFYKIRNLGAKSIDELITVVEYTVAAYYCNDLSTLYSDDFIYEKVQSCFFDIGFKGLSYKEIKETFPEEIEDDRIKKAVGKLIADKKLEYVDFRCYRVYPSVLDVIEQSLLSAEDKDIILNRLSGDTLESIAQNMGLTRERVRQKVNDNIKKLRLFLQSEYDIDCFDEDYYAHLFTTYEVSNELWRDYLCVPEMTVEYLTNTYSKGKNKIEKALNDDAINMNLKFKIQDYLNRNKILLEGVLVEKNRVDIEDFVLSKICIDEMSYDEFTEQYNIYLEKNGIKYDEKIYYTEDIRRTRANRLSASMKCLWKQGEMLRYYDIAGHDYTELLETLNLESFENTEISTLKFMEDYPDVMKKFDIRDQYELHNLLKKIIDTNDYHDMVFHRQPIIQFGEFDRDKAIYDIFETVAPVTAEELAEYLNMEYGYDKATIITSCMKVLKQYYHNGIFSIDFKRIPEERISVFKEKLTEDFYYISEIKQMYMDMFSDRDIEEINPRSLKTLGFNVYSKYALQNHPSLYEYFKYILTKDDVYDITPYRKRYGLIQMYQQVARELRTALEIFPFEKDQMITFKRLSKVGITKQDIADYCEEACEYAEDESYFTIHSLRDAGFVSDLDDLGFDFHFYASLLAMSNKFSYTQIFGETVLYKGENVSEISKKSFILDQLSKYDCVDIEEFKDDCFALYGIKIPDKYEIMNAISGTDFYYDSIMDKIYRNKEVYYSEFDD